MAVKPFSGSYPISQKFGANPGWYGPGGHRGIDYGLPYNTPVIAVANGTVRNMGFQSGGFGNHLTLTFGPYICYYGHLRVVSRTGAVRAGQIIGYSNSTGWSTGNHLHFEVYKNRTLINPQTLLNALSAPAPVTTTWPKKKTVKVPRLNVRTGPSTIYPLRKNRSIPNGYLTKGQTIWVYGQTKGQSVGGISTWYKTVSGAWVWAGGF